MKTLLLILVAVVAGCQCLAIDRFEMAQQEPEKEVDCTSGVGCRGPKYVAFMTYLSEHQDLGKNQKVKFDKILLNDGKAYNPHTGAFRAPKCGVYAFSFAVHTKDKKPLNVRLMVDDKNIDGAVAEGNKGSHDSKGGHMGINTAVIHVCKNHVVYVEAMDAAHIEGSQSERYTTFSGHLLYERKKEE